MGFALIKRISFKYSISILITIISLPLFLKIADFSRFVIFTAGLSKLIKGTLAFYYRRDTALFLLCVIISICISVWLMYKIIKRRLFLDLSFLLGALILAFEILPVHLMTIVKPDLLIFYIILFVSVYLFLVLRRSPYEFVRTFAITSAILFPFFAILLLIGFNGSAARPKTTILNGGPSHNWYDEVCDKKRLLSQKEVIPIWIEDAWLYGGVSTADGRYFYFSDNGYGIIGFEVSKSGKYHRLPLVKYPQDFKAALYSHRLYLTPDEKYLYYYGARSAEFVFIDRERLEVAYIVPTQHGLDGFSAAYDTRRDMIYGFPFIGKKIPVLHYNKDNVVLTKWIDFSSMDGWVVQGFYNKKRDTLMVHTSSIFAEYDAGSLNPIKSIQIGPLATRSDYIEESQILLFSNIFLKKMDILNLDPFEIHSYRVPFGIRELFSLDDSDKILLFDFSGSRIYIMQETKILKEIYSGPRPRGMAVLPNTKDIIIGSGCGLFRLNIEQKQQ